MALIKSRLQPSGVDVTYWNIERITFNRNSNIIIQVLGYLSENAKKVQLYGSILQMNISLPWSLITTYKDSTLQELYVLVYTEI